MKEDKIKRLKSKLNLKIPKNIKAIKIKYKRLINK